MKTWWGAGIGRFAARLVSERLLIGSCGLLVFCLPVWGQSVGSLPYAESRFGVFGAYSVSEYEIFKARVGLDNAQYWNWADGHFRNLGARWTRSTIQLIWDRIDPELDETYDWNSGSFLTDSVITNIYKSGNELHWLGVFHEGNLFGERSGLSPLSDTNKYCRFVRAAVERYKGGGVGAVSSSVQVRHWQLGNEAPRFPNPDKRANYVRWVKMAAGTIRATDPGARIVLIAEIAGAQGVSFMGWASNVVSDLADGQWFDALDVHYWSSWDKYKMPGVKDARQYLDHLGLTNVQIWSCENGTWADRPVGEVYQTQEDQARGLVRRYVYNLDLGLDKLFWENLVEWANFNGQTGSLFNSMGLIGDGLGNGEATNNLNVPRVSYYTYKRLAAAIDTDRARYVGKMAVHREPDLYAYAFQAQSTVPTNRYILWRDTATQSVTFAINTRQASVTSFITDKQGNALAGYVATADSGGNLTVEVGLDPLLVEELVEPQRIQGLAFQLDGTLRLDMESVTGRSFVVEASTNLWSWVPIGVHSPTALNWSVSDPDASNFLWRFYRLGRLGE